MIASLPDSLEINGRKVKLKSSDYRVALIVFQALNDPDMPDYEKAYVMVDALLGWENVGDDERNDALEKCLWFLNGGKANDERKGKPKLMDWEQDEQMIFSAVNRIAGKEVRELPYMHWWTFLGYFQEIGEGLFSTIILIRQKLAKGKKLDEWESEFYAEHKEQVDIKERYSEAEKRRMERLNKLLQ